METYITAKIELRKFISLFLSASILVLSLTHGSTAFAAETGDYPWFDASEVNLASFDWGYTDCQLAMVQAETCSVHYGYKNSVRYHESDPWRYDVRNCTSYVAWRASSQLGKDLTGFGNANNWATSAASRGYSVDNQPRVNDVAVWTGGKWGHVAFVTGVNENNTVNIDQYNRAGKGEFSRQSRVRADGYIHLVNPTELQNPVVVKQADVAPVTLPKIDLPAVTPATLTAIPSSTPDSQATNQSSDSLNYVYKSSDNSKELITLHGNKTSSGNLEVDVNNETDDKTSSKHFVTAQASEQLKPSNFLVADQNADGVPDVYKIDSSAPKLNVTILDGASDYKTAKSTTTNINSADQSSLTLGDYDGDGNLDLFQMSNKTDQVTQGHVTIYDGKTNFTKTLGSFGLPEESYAKTDAYYQLGDNNNDGKLDIYQVLHNNTKSNKIEVKVFDGSNNFGSLIAKWTTTSDTYSADGPQL